MEKKKKPIGYYLKKADNLLTGSINNIHAELGLTRTGWQILNSIKEGTDKHTILAQLSGFASAEQLNETFSSLAARGWIVDNSTLKLTGEGEETFKNCLQKQTVLRQKSMQNITEQEYLQLITTLEKIIDNLK